MNRISGGLCGAVRSHSIFLFILLLLCPSFGSAQSTNATLTGFVTDESKAVVPQVKVAAVNEDTNVRYFSVTNNEGSYAVTNLPPGSYKIEVEKPGFKSIVKSDVVLHVQDVIAINFMMAIGSVSEVVTVEAGAPLVNASDASVSTVVDRQFAENLPLNGRSFQTLIQLTPGVVVTPPNFGDNGQFSVNGQRAGSNYWMVDGVSANVGVGTFSVGGNGLAGANTSLSILGGTNSLVSVDALQEFRIQTSTFAPEFGRTPGGQVSIVTRSGTNQWHGSAFDYLRNDVFDANDWFANYNHLPKPQERQNDFGGVFSGPILKNRTFVFLSYEGLRLRLPQVVQSLVPDLNARQNAVPTMQPFLNGFPLPSPNTADDLANGIAHFNASFSNSAALDAYSLRIDHKLDEHFVLFGRYNYSPSTLTQRGGGSNSLSLVTPSQITIQTATLGATWAASAALANDLRLNYSRTNSESHSYQDTFGGAVPITPLPFPSGFNASNGQLILYWVSLGGSEFVGFQGHNLQRQMNLVDNVSLQKGAHALKFGVDFRQLSPFYGNAAYTQEAVFADVLSSTVGALDFSFLASGRSALFHFHNLGAFGQDTWRINPALTVTYGVRWDVDFAPSSDPALVAVTGFSASDLSHLAVAPAGTPLFQTRYGNVAPRVGVAYRVTASPNWQTVLRGGFGVFYDLATSEVGNVADTSAYPLGSSTISFGGTYPFSAAAAIAPPITPATLTLQGSTFDPHLQLPYTLEWNVALQQALGSQQTLSLSYVGATGRRLIHTAQVLSPNGNFGDERLVSNAGNSDYDALQVQFQRRLSHGFQSLASYTWSHSIDTASGGSEGVFSNDSGLLLAESNRGPSDFDIRHSLSVGLTYDIPSPRTNLFGRAILRGWSLEHVLQAHSAAPVSIVDTGFVFVGKNLTGIRPDVVAGQSFYLYGSQYPGGKAFNPAAFEAPPLDSSGNPVRQGDLGRNALRGFGAWQWDLAVHRDFPIRESLKLEFRAEMFNVLNHPNFAAPIADISNTSQFGLSTQTLGNYLSGGTAGIGGFSPLYQIGGPRSIQLALKFQF